jgi:hypothetical protein
VPKSGGWAEWLDPPACHPAPQLAWCTEICRSVQVGLQARRCDLIDVDVVRQVIAGGQVGRLPQRRGIHHRRPALPSGAVDHLLRNRLAADAVYRAAYQHELTRTLSIRWAEADRWAIARSWGCP